MEWLEVSVTIESKYQEAVSQILLDQEVQGLEIVDPEAFRQVYNDNKHLDYTDDGFIESFGKKVIIRAYFSSSYSIESLKHKLDTQFQEFMDWIPEYNILRRSDTEWKDNWRKYYKTFKISDRVVIKPSWEDYSPVNDEVVIELEPGMAFGTGTHQTTEMCAKLLDHVIKGNERVLDLGCGTGILGIIAAKLGAKNVLCVDVDDAACKVATENAQKNNVSDVVDIKHGELQDIEKKEYDIIVVNIIADVIISLLPDLKAYCSNKTNILLSGIISDRREEVYQVAKEQGYDLVSVQSMGEWVAMQICTGF